MTMLYALHNKHHLLLWRTMVGAWHIEAGWAGFARVKCDAGSLAAQARSAPHRRVCAAHVLHSFRKLSNAMLRLRQAAARAPGLHAGCRAAACQPA